jgi:hypothetical protein
MHEKPCCPDHPSAGVVLFRRFGQPRRTWTCLRCHRHLGDAGPRESGDELQQIEKDAVGCLEAILPGLLCKHQARLAAWEAAWDRSRRDDGPVLVATREAIGLLGPDAVGSLVAALLAGAAPGCMPDGVSLVIHGQGEGAPELWVLARAREPAP